MTYDDLFRVADGGFDLFLSDSSVSGPLYEPAFCVIGPHNFHVIRKGKCVAAPRRFEVNEKASLLLLIVAKSPDCRSRKFRIFVRQSLDRSALVRYKM